MGGAPELRVPTWSVPYRRNPFFTGQEDILTRLRTALTVNKTAALTQQATPQAISGLGGIGKTQVALEYAYRYGYEYQSVLWVTAESREVLTSDYAAIAELLHLERKKEDQNQAIQGVKRWLDSLTRWLLILDNADDPQILHDFIPLMPKGHVLITTRTQFMGTIAQVIELDVMEP